jgi:Mn2+/Fe2+ NRAMP family transporter|tara:strand:- start:299 stop:493 length:195 start_codon:yes stop_codon:yes gene_type:complete
MLEKTGILFVTLVLLFIFYLVIRLGAGKKKDIAKSQEITNYLSGVRILIIILAIVALILWFFLN